MRIALLFLLACTTTSFGQTKSKELLSDLKLLKTTLESYHPSLYRFTPKESFDSLFNLCYNSIDDQTTDLQFYRMISKIESLVREGHTGFGPSDVILEKIRTSPVFPLEIIFNSGKMFVVNSALPEYEHLIGSEIISINGKGIQTIISLLSKSTGIKSGYTDVAMLATLSLFHNFGVAYYTYIDTSNSFAVECIDRQGNASMVNLNGRKADYPKDRLLKIWAEPKTPVTWRIDEENQVGILKITAFAYWVLDVKKKFYLKKYDEFFNSVANKKIKSIVIDVRDNRGGEELLGAELITYLSDHDFIIYESVKTKSMTFEELKDIPGADLPRFTENGFDENNGDYFLKSDNSDVMKIFERKKKNHFDGKIYWLANSRSWSAASVTTTLARTHTDAIIIGQETGAAFQDLDGRWRINFELPYSKMKISFPAWGLIIKTEKGNPNRGVIPDHEVSRNLSDILTNKDVEMEFVYKLIRQSK